MAQAIFPPHLLCMAILIADPAPYNTTSAAYDADIASSWRTPGCPLVWIPTSPPTA
jgi:hypothetical protein